MAPTDLRDTVLPAWRTTSRVTEYLVEQIPASVWPARVPGVPTRTVRAIAAHIHNARCNWIRTLGLEHGIAQPEHVDHRTVTPRRLLPALRKSGRGIAALLELGCEHGGSIPACRLYVWRNLPLDVGHVLSYFVAHEGHHRGQLLLIARQLGCRLPASAMAGLWQWQTRSREGARPRA